MEALVQLVAVLAPVGSGFLGYLGAMRSEEKRRERQREARHDEQRAEREVRWAAFQRKTLIELQDVVQDFIRAYGAIQHHDVMVSRQEGEWTLSPTPEDVNDAAHQSGVAMLKLASRIEDDQVREPVQAIRETTLPIGTTVQSEAEGHAALTEATRHLQAFHARAGSLIRSLPA